MFKGSRRTKAPVRRGTIFTRVGYHVMDKKGNLHEVWYRDYHLLTPLWKSISMESLAALERVRQVTSQPVRMPAVAQQHKQKPRRLRFEERQPVAA